ncbi:hypothetical protein YC2023_078652 [Brassica napus]
MEVAVNRVVAVVVQGVAVAGCKERGAAVQGVAAVAVKDVRTMVVLGNEQRPNGDTEPVNDNPENRLAIWDLKEPKDQYPRRADLKPVSADLGKDDSAKRQTSYTNASAFVMRNQNIRSEVAERRRDEISENCLLQNPKNRLNHRSPDQNLAAKPKIAETPPEPEHLARGAPYRKETLSQNREQHKKRGKGREDAPGAGTRAYAPPDAGPELMTNQAIFGEDSELQQLLHIFR